MLTKNSKGKDAGINKKSKASHSIISMFET